MKEVLRKQLDFAWLKSHTLLFLDSLECRFPMSTIGTHSDYYPRTLTSCYSYCS